MEDEEEEEEEYIPCAKKKHLSSPDRMSLEHTAVYISHNSL